MPDTGNIKNIPIIEALEDNILLVDYTRCNEINRDSLIYAQSKMPDKAAGDAPVDVLLILKGTRSYNIKLMDMVTIHRGFHVNRAAWVIEGRVAGFLTRLFGGGSILSHKIAMFEDYDQALDWLRKDGDFKRNSV